jgi:hypothetical protein
MDALHLEDSFQGISDLDFVKIISDCFAKLGLEVPVETLQTLSHEHIMEYVSWIEERAKATKKHEIIEMLEFAGVVCS